MKLTSVEWVNIAAVLLLIILFNSFFLYYLHETKKKSCHQALYERSHHLLLIANFTNFIQSVLNILFGVLTYEDSFSSNEFLMSYYTIATFFTRIYAISMGLRVFRINTLHQLRKGSLNNKYHILIEWQFSLIVSSIYASLITGIYFLIYFLISHSAASSLFIQFIYSLESFVLFISSYILFNRARHPSITLEYIFYSLIWLTGIERNNESRTFYIIPIRNTLLLTVSALSLYCHNNLIRPSFPSDLELCNLVEIEEVFEDFSRFVKENGTRKENDALRIYFKIKMSEFCVKDEIFGRIIDEFISSTELIGERNSLTLFNVEVIEDTVKEVIAGISEVYLKSDDFKRMKRSYFINYN